MYERNSYPGEYWIWRLSRESWLSGSFLAAFCEFDCEMPIGSENRIVPVYIGAWFQRSIEVKMDHGMCSIQLHM